MAECQICRRNGEGLKFQTQHIRICADCVSELNEWSELSYQSQGRVGDLLREGMARRNPNYDEEQFRNARPRWFNFLLANKKNNSRDFKVMRAARHGLLRKTGVTPWDYPSDWKQKAHRIRERDKGCCQSCGASNVQLDVHHIIYLSNWGTNQQSNLITLCRPCHETEHGRKFDFGEPDEPGNEHPVRPKRGQRPKVKKVTGPRPPEYIDESILDEIFHDVISPPKQSTQPNTTGVSTAHLLSPVDLWCPKCATKFTAQLPTTRSETQVVRCPFCPVVFRASEGLEKRSAKPAAPAPAPAPAPTTSVNEQIQEMMNEAIRVYPYLNTDQGLEATREIILARNQLLVQGYLPDAALRIAIEQVAPKHAPRHVNP